MSVQPSALASPLGAVPQAVPRSRVSSHDARPTSRSRRSIRPSGSSSTAARADRAGLGAASPVGTAKLRAPLPTASLVVAGRDAVRRRRPSRPARASMTTRAPIRPARFGRSTRSTTSLPRPWAFMPYAPKAKPPWTGTGSRATPFPWTATPISVATRRSTRTRPSMAATLLGSVSRMAVSMPARAFRGAEALTTTLPATSVAVPPAAAAAGAGGVASTAVAARPTTWVATSRTRTSPTSTSSRRMTHLMAARTRSSPRGRATLGRQVLGSLPRWASGTWRHRRAPARPASTPPGALGRQRGDGAHQERSGADPWRTPPSRRRIGGADAATDPCAAR